MTVWTALAEAKDAALYEADPLAFWLRPDRHEHGVPCWMIDQPYVPKPPPERDDFGVDPVKEAAARAINIQSARLVHLLPGENIEWREGDAWLIKSRHSRSRDVERVW